MTKHCRKPSHLQTKENQFVVIQIEDALWRKLNNTKPFLVARRALRLMLRMVSRQKIQC